MLYPNTSLGLLDLDLAFQVERSAAIIDASSRRDQTK